MSEGDKGVIGVGPTIKRCDEFTNTLLKIKINLTGKDKEKEMVMTKMLMKRMREGTGREETTDLQELMQSTAFL